MPRAPASARRSSARPRPSRQCHPRFMSDSTHSADERLALGAFVWHCMNDGQCRGAMAVPGAGGTSSVSVAVCLKNERIPCRDSHAASHLLVLAVVSLRWAGPTGPPDRGRDGGWTRRSRSPTRLVAPESSAMRASRCRRANERPWTTRGRKKSACAGRAGEPREGTPCVSLRRRDRAVWSRTGVTPVATSGGE